MGLTKGCLEIVSRALFLPLILHLRLHDQVEAAVGQETDEAQDDVEDDFRIIPDELQGSEGEKEDDEGNGVGSPIHGVIIQKI